MTALAILVFGCQPEKRMGSDLPPVLFEYINAYTSGLVDAKGPLKVYFHKAVDHPYEDAATFIKIKPRQNLRIEWVSENELAIHPKKAFSPTETYTMEVGVHHLFDDLDDQADLVTTFNIRSPYVEVQYGRLYPNGKDSLIYTGRLRDFGFTEDVSAKIQIDALLDQVKVDLRGSQDGRRRNDFYHRTDSERGEGR